MTQQGTPSQESRDSRETAGDAAKDLKNEARDSAERLKDRATEEVQRQGEAAKASAADEISQIGSALRRAAGELREGSPQERSFGQMADALADVSDTIRDKDFGEMASDLSSFARRNPLAFLGGAALLGFAGTRMVRASERNRGDSVDLANAFGSAEDDDAMEAEILGRQPAAPVAPAAPASPGASASASGGMGTQSPTSPASPAISTSGADK